MNYGTCNLKKLLQSSKKIRRFSQGAPVSESLFNILEILFTKEEAELVSKLPTKPFTGKSVDYSHPEMSWK